MADRASEWQQLAPGEALTRWAMAAPVERLYPGAARPMQDRVDYQFVNGRVDVGELPCRQALRAELPGRHVVRPTGPFPQIIFGFDGPNVDFSRFCHRPTLIVRAFQCRIRADAAGLAGFRIATCGGVRLWLAKYEIACFEPFQRNRPQTAEVDVELPAGEATLTLRLEDLHERDTTCFFSLTYLGGPALAAAPAFETGLGELETAAALLTRLRTDRVFAEDGTLSLVADPPPAAPVSLRIDGIVPFSRGGLSRDRTESRSIQATLTPQTPFAPLLDAADTQAGCLSFQVSVPVGSAWLIRHLGTTNLPPGTPLAGDLARRKAQAADLIATHAGFEPSVAALLALRGEQPDRVERILSAALTTNEERHDCSDFSILPVLRIWRDGRRSLDAALRDRLRAALLGYRYWLDAPGDDVMWFWSENHVLCFHAAQMIAGGLFPDAIFTNSGKTGHALRAEALARLLCWFDATDQHGLCEWNSAAYYPIDLLALLTLHDMEPALADRCAALMDRIFVMTGLHSSGGVPAGSAGRCYEKELLAGPATELGSIAAIALGGDFRPGYDRAAALFCLSNYTPPDVAKEFAAPAGTDWLEARYSQGLGQAGKLTLWKSAQGQLSTVTDLMTGAQGHQAQVLDVQLSGHPMARLWVNHPGDLKVWGERRPSLLAGNHVMPRVAQSGPTALMIYDLDRPWTDLRFTQVFAAPGAFDDRRKAGNWQVFGSNGGQVAVWCSRPLEGVTGLYENALLRAHGLRTGWVVALPHAAETRAQFDRRLRGASPRFDPDALRLCAAGHGGSALELRFDGGLSVDGIDRPFDAVSPIPQIGWNGAPPKPWTAI